MNPLLRSIFLVALGWVAAGAAAHPATERYVPIGYWASVGVTDTYLGSVTDVSARADAVSFVDGGVSKNVRITDATRIYVDRSHLNARSRDGTREDLRAGQTMEIKLAADGSAAWIKIRAER